MLFPQKGWVKAVCALFYALQAALAGWVVFNGWSFGVELPLERVFFTPDALGTLFFVILAILSPLVFWTSCWYLDEESRRHFRLYHLLLLLLCVALTGVYFANNLAVTWILVEVTTLTAAGLVYHRRSPRSLEATWKYLFVCSVGIAIAYLGILLLSTAVQGNMSYENIATLIAGGNPLYMKIAFLLVLIGYSCKMEVFPLYTVGVDANSAAPTPASALISTGLVNGGFVAIFRIYKVFEASEVFPWARGVLIVAGVASLLVGTLFMRRTNNLKRLLSYSTVENMGIVLIGLGVGGMGVFAALLLLVGHSLLKAGLFLQIARVGKIYGTYRINRIGNYLHAEPLGAVVMVLLGLLVAAFPPSPLFLSEVMIFGEVIESGRWWLLATMVLLACVVIYNFAGRLLRISYQPAPIEGRQVRGTFTRFIPLLLLLSATLLGVWQGNALVEFLNGIVR